MADAANEPVRASNKWDSNADKIALDDSVKKILSKQFGWTEKHTLVDGRLALSLIACCFSGFALIWDYLHPFPVSRPILLICVLTYGALMCLLQLYIWYVEGNVFYQALDEDAAGREPTRRWKWHSKIKKYGYDDEYELTAEFRSGNGSYGTATMAKSIGAWIDDDGFVVEPLLKHDVLQLHSGLLSKKGN